MDYLSYSMNQIIVFVLHCCTCGLTSDCAAVETKYSMNVEVQGSRVTNTSMRQWQSLREGNFLFPEAAVEEIILRFVSVLVTASGSRHKAGQHRGMQGQGLLPCTTTTPKTLFQTFASQGTASSQSHCTAVKSS